MSVIKGAPVAEAMGEEIRQRVEVLKNDGIEPEDQSNNRTD